MTYPDHIRAAARALMFQGYSSERVHRELQAEFGDDVPDPWTIRKWRRDSPEISEEEKQLIEDHEQTLALRFDNLLHRKLDEAEGDLSKVRIPELVMGSGVFRDKSIKREEVKRGISPAILPALLEAIAEEAARLRALAPPTLIITEEKPDGG